MKAQIDPDQQQCDAGTGEDDYPRVRAQNLNSADQRVMDWICRNFFPSQLSSAHNTFPVTSWNQKQA
jgi:hypothetical protein